MNHSVNPLEENNRISAAWLIVPCVACDLLMVPTLSRLKFLPLELAFVLMFGIIGCTLTQGSLLAAFLAWGNGPFLRRLSTHWIIVAGLYLAWLVGMCLSGIEEPEVAATVALGIPLVSLSAQFPLWLARQWFGWRLVNVTAGSAQPAEPPLAIRDLLLATFLVATSLALARLAPAFQGSKELWPSWGVACAAASIISAIAILPAGALLLRPQQYQRGLVWGSLYALSCIALLWIVVAVIWWYDPALLAPRNLFVGHSSLMSTYSATLLLTAALAHSRGYRLIWGRRGIHDMRP